MSFKSEVTGFVQQKMDAKTVIKVAATIGETSNESNVYTRLAALAFSGGKTIPGFSFDKAYDAFADHYGVKAEEASRKVYRSAFGAWVLAGQCKWDATPIAERIIGESKYAMSARGGWLRRILTDDKGVLRDKAPSAKEIKDAAPKNRSNDGPARVSLKGKVSALTNATAAFKDVKGLSPDMGRLLAQLGALVARINERATIDIEAAKAAAKKPGASKKAGAKISPAAALEAMRQKFGEVTTSRGRTVN